MGIDEQIKQEETNHLRAVESMFEVEKKLEHLYTEKTLADELYQRLKNDEVDVQIVQRSSQNEVRLRKGKVVVACIASTLSSALLGAHTAFQGEMTHVI